jgi:uncharacterized membrane protein
VIISRTMVSTLVSVLAIVSIILHGMELLISSARFVIDFLGLVLCDILPPASRSPQIDEEDRL